MREQRRPNRILAGATALALILAGCGTKIEPTDLAPVQVENDRTVIERALGGPDEVVEAHGFTVAAYTYDRGYVEKKSDFDFEEWLRSKPEGGPVGSPYDGGWLLIAAIILPFALASEASKVKEQQRGHLAAVYGADDKLLFAGVLEKTGATSANLTAIAARYSAAQSGDADALYELSKTAFKQLQKSALLEEAAKKGSADALYEMANVAAEDADKIVWLRKAASQGHTQAQTDLGMLLIYGQRDLVDRTEARVWPTKAADAGVGQAKTELANLSEFETYLAGAERGDPAAQYALGQAYANRTAVRRDLTQAVFWWRQAAEGGHPPAQVSLVKIYSFGVHVPVNLAIAKDWARKVESHNDRAALVQLAKMYRFGPDTIRNMHEAIRLFERAAVMGDRAALYDLGTIYMNGEGVAPDKSQAYAWFVLAASRDDQAAAFSRDRVAEDMTPAQIAAAERMAREWREAHPQ
jgi:TPR repeat protein